MIISESWLREWVDSELTTEEIAATLTMAGLEVEGIAPVAREFIGVVVAHCVSTQCLPQQGKESSITRAPTSPFLAEN